MRENTQSRLSPVVMPDQRPNIRVLKGRPEDDRRRERILNTTSTGTANRIADSKSNSGFEEPMAERKATNVKWHEHNVTSEEREKLNGHKGAVLWFTGLSGCGKSTIANAVDRLLHDRGIHTFVLDGDNIRMGLNKNLDFSPEDRTENIRRIGEVAKLFCDAGTIVLTAFISPYREDRNQVRDIMAEGRFHEVLVDASLETCEARDPKGLYKKARAGDIKEFTGIDAPYEAPENGELTLDSDSRGVEELANEVIAYLEAQGVLAA